MPKPVSSGQRYQPGLDGLRALAVLAVIAFHEQFGWAPGGLLGVGVFFTLSGFLITSLLIGQWSARGRIGLGDFWLKRARRLLPALFVMLAVLTAWVTLADRARLAGLRGAVGAAAGYFSNWYLIGQHQSYFSRFAPPAPLDHLWSLAVEEQFYLLWPLLLMGGLLVVRGRGVAAVRWLAVPTLLLAGLSIAAMVRFYQPGLDPTRVYEGTDTRAFGLLIGAALALAWPTAGIAREQRGGGDAPHPAPGSLRGGSSLRHRITAALAGHGGEHRRGSRAALGRIGVDVAGWAGLAVIGVMIWRVGQYSPFAYRGGLVLLSAATAAVVAAAVWPGTLVGMALGWGPLRWIGARSYGIYLWHYPVIVLTTPANSGPDLARAVLQIGASVGLAAVSWRFVEEPVRHGAIERAAGRVRAARMRVREAKVSGLGAAGGLGATRGLGAAGGMAAASGRGVARRLRRVRPAGLAATTGAAGVLVVAAAGLTGTVHAPRGAGAGSLTSAGSPQLPVTKSVVKAPAGGAGSGAGAGGSGASASGSGAAGAGSGAGAGGSGAGAGGSGAGGVKASASPSPTAPPGTPGGPPLRTSCRAVAHIGDSTSDGLVSPDYLPKPGERITARYEDVGVRTVVTDISGARSVVEVLPGQVNGYGAMRAISAQGFRGCWVIALGTNDTADVAAGSTYTLRYRINKIMSAARGEPVMWVNVKSLLVSGPYAEPNMIKWDNALLRACDRYPNLRIYNWAAQVRRKWFISDGIHYTSIGYKHRAKMIADALANAFPQDGQSTGCVVSS